MDKFRVTRGKVYWHRKVFKAGEYLPEDFTEKDIHRTLYPSRIEKVSTPEATPKQSPVKQTTVKQAAAKQATPKTETKVVAGVGDKTVTKSAETTTGKLATTATTGTSGTNQKEN